MNASNAQRIAPDDLAPPDFYDPVIEALKKNVDRAALRENLKLTPEQRLLKAEQRFREVGWMDHCQGLLNLAHSLIAEAQVLLDERRKTERAG